MNPFDLSGPAFLFLYALLLALSFPLRQLARGFVPQVSAELSAEPLSPYEVAFLAGGRGGVIDAAVTKLVQQGQIEVRRRLFPSARPTNDAGRGTLTLGPHDGELEAQILEQLPASGVQLRALRRARVPAVEAIHARLAELQLIFPRRAQQMVFALSVAPVFVLLIFGGVKLGVGLSRDKPVGFLLLLLAFNAVQAFLVARHPGLGITHRGAARLEALRAEHAALELTSRSAPEQLLPHEAALGYGLFGTSVLSGPMAVVGEQILVFGSSVDASLARADARLRASFRQPSDGSGGGWGGTSCGGSSCGGSSCSGGCGGGGCGGCSS